ncbi:MAG: tRNA pseudouridine(54/55) synthase Pus10 [Thermoplasmata archaeon]|nr:tRNA pseudouridine(54/55) synthase Pus10 [Thermoplasmata archaeon]
MEAGTSTFPIDDKVRAAARAARPLGLCPECYGRIFGRLGHGLSNPERAERLSAELGEPLPATPDPCALCHGAFDRWETWVERSLSATAGFEWHRFSCGSRWEPETLAREEANWVMVGSEWGESARGAFNRELGKRIEARTGSPGGPERPEVVILADLPVGRVELTVLSLYLRGRYRKFDRTVPQTRWPCRRCQGRGCETCSGTGKTYPTSVEELVAAPVLAVTGGLGSRFHGMGREDIDARMLGDGRPFVLELLQPRVRTLDIPSLVGQINSQAAGRVEVLELALAQAADVVKVKEASPQKSYRVDIAGDYEVGKVNEALAFVAGRAIAQRTPQRVVHRRSDRVRSRRVVSVRLVESGPGRFVLELRADAGTYVKEWVEGDGGRTEPNLSSLLGVPLKVTALDVVQIHDREA